jgi:hypothetical protein
MKIIKYSIVGGKFQEVLDEVRELIEEGWQPWGNLQVQLDPDENAGKDWFYQPMVKYEEQCDVTIKGKYPTSMEIKKHRTTGDWNPES